MILVIKYYTISADEGLTIKAVYFDSFFVNLTSWGRRWFGDNDPPSALL